MSDRITISLVQLFEMFPNNDTARQYLESRLWPQGVRCPDCKQGERIHFERSHLSLSPQTQNEGGQAKIGTEEASIEEKVVMYINPQIRTVPKKPCILH